MKNKLTATLTFIGLISVTSPQAFSLPPSDITFGTSTAFSGDSIIINNGIFQYAVATGSASAVTNVGSQNLTFSADNGTNITISTLNPDTYNGYLSGGGSTGNVGFDTVLTNGDWNNPSNGLPATVTLNNLVAGRTYTVQVFVADTRPGEVGRTFNVNGGTKGIYAFNAGTPTIGSYVIGTFTATDGNNYFSIANFDSAINGGAQFSFQINGLVVDLTSYNISTTTPGLTPNQFAIATNLDTASLTGSLGPIISTISNSSPQQIASDLNQLSPQKLQVLRNIAFDNFGFVVTSLDNHLASLRYGQGGFDTSGLAVLNSADSPMMSQIKSRLLAFNPAPDNSGIVSDSVDSMLGYVKMTDPKDLKQMCSAPDENRWSAFIDGNVILADISHTSDLSHSDYTTGGVTAGLDYRLDENFAVGGLFGYGHTDATLDEDGSHARVDSYSPGIYATYSDHGWYMNGLAAYNYNSYGESRAIPFAGLNANGETRGNQFDTNLDGGYEFHSGNWTYGPTLAAQFVHLEINSFNESDAGPANLSVDSQQDDSLRSRLGGEVRYQAGHCGDVIFTPHLSASWQHEFLDNSRGITSQFSGQGLGSFVVQGSNTDRDSALIDLGLDTQINRTLSGFVDYQTQVGQSDFFAQSIQAGFKIGF